MKKYKNIVGQIRDLPWPKLSSRGLEISMVLGAFAALEFAGSSRIALVLYPDSPAFQELAAGELDTDNLVFGGYNQRGDHAAFLWHFIRKHKLVEIYPEAVAAGEQYLADIRTLSREVRAMSIVSREHELPGIFNRILQATDWSTPALQAFRYYLERHIELDSGEGGHADLLSGFEVTDAVADFYEFRLKMYRCIPTLFAQ
jgi:hypothetical protein